jgi:hypothetical protein
MAAAYLTFGSSRRKSASLNHGDAMLLIPQFNAEAFRMRLKTLMRVIQCVMFAR